MNTRAPLTITLAIAIGGCSMAQSFKQGDNVLGVGFGIGGTYSIGFSGSGVSQTPVIGLHFDHAMGDLGPGVWGLGGYVGYKKISYTESYFNFYKYDYSYTYLIIGARGTWHYNEWHGNNKLDTYGGVMLSYNSVTYKDNTNYGVYGNLRPYSYNGGGMGVSAFVGARYYFTDKIGVFGEAGFGLALLQLGLDVKL